MTTTPDDATITVGYLDLARHWVALLVAGLITLGIGLIALVWPGETLVVLAVLFGIHLLVSGILRLVTAFTEGGPFAGLLGFVGVVSLIGGVVIVRHPFGTVEVLATLLGAVWIVAGCVDLIGALADHTRPDRGWSLLSGILSLGAGIVIVAWPAPSLAVVAWVSGLYLIAAGVLIVALAFKVRSLAT